MRISDWSSDVCSSDLFLFPMRGWKDALLEYTAASVEVLVPHEGLEGTVGPRPGRQQLVLVPHEGLEANAASPAGAPGTPGVLVPHEGVEVTALSRDRKSGGWGKSVSVSVDLGGRRSSKKKKKNKKI